MKKYKAKITMEKGKGPEAGINRVNDMRRIMIPARVLCAGAIAKEQRHDL